MKKWHWHSEIIYLVATLMVSLGVALSIAANFGISVLSAPAYLLHLKIGFSMTISEYLCQIILIIIFCIIMKEVRILYLSTFITTIIYGLFLRLIQFIPCFSEGIELNIFIRILYLSISILLISLAISLFARTYLYPQIYDLFIIAIPNKYHLNQGIFKLINDLSFLAISVLLGFLFFGKLMGVGIGSIIFAVITGPLVNIWNKLLDKLVMVTPLSKNLETIFIGNNNEKEDREKNQN